MTWSSDPKEHEEYVAAIHIITNTVDTAARHLKALQIIEAAVASIECDKNFRSFALVASQAAQAPELFKLTKESK